MTIKAFYCWLTLILVCLVTSGCVPRSGLTGAEKSRLELVPEIKAFEQQAGFRETNNFLTYSLETRAYDYYFYTPNTELPYSLDDPRLRFGSGTTANITLDLRQYDVFFYSIPALAGIATPLTRSLLDAPLPRFIQVIFHEDGHEQIELPLGIEEPSAEVVGYAAAILFAWEKYGRSAGVTRDLRRDFSNRLAESRVYADYYRQLEALYASYHGGFISEPETLRRKKDLLAAMGKELRGIWGAAPEPLNNAYIAFQMTYLRHLPLLYEVYSTLDDDLARTVAFLQGMPQQGAPFTTLDEVKAIEAQVTDYLRQALP